MFIEYHPISKNFPTLWAFKFLMLISNMDLQIPIILIFRFTIRTLITYWCGAAGLLLVGGRWCCCLAMYGLPPSATAAWLLKLLLSRCRSSKLPHCKRLLCCQPHLPFV